MAKAKTSERVPQIVLPHAWKPRPWQARCLAAFQRGIKRFCIVVHRRAGKDQLGLNMAAIASQHRIGLYQHVFPTEKSNRSAIWMGMDKLDGRRFIDQAFPEQLRERARDHTMEIEFKNGSLWKCIGSDNYNALRGGNPLGVVFSEYAFADPASWTSIIAPILRENGGWAAFISTPNGPNHFRELYDLAVANPAIWHTEYLTVDDTGLLTPEDIEAAKIEDGLTDADVRREFYCDWFAVFSGTYYAKELEAMRAQGRIGQVDYDPRRSVFAAWDLGFADELVALFFQKNAGAHYCIGSRSWEFTKFEDALADCKQVFPWSVEKHFLPHDTASQTLRGFVIDAFTKAGADVSIIDRSDVTKGIEIVRGIFPTLWIDNAKRPWAPTGNNARLVDAIGGYRASNTKNGVFSRTPVHSWESHFADALRYYAIASEIGETTGNRWGPAPNYAQADRAVV